MGTNQKKTSTIDTSFLDSITTKKAIFIIVILGFVVFFNSLFNGFVWDDIFQILHNNTVQSLRNIDDFFLGLYISGQGSLYPYYRPLFLTAITFIYHFFQQNAFFYHFFQLTLHIVNSCLIFILFKNFINNKLSFFLALIFLVHPINTEPVVYISALQEPMFLLFGLLGFIILNKDHIGFKRLIIGATFLTLSVFSKETGFLFLFAACIYHLIFSKKTFKKIAFTSTSVLGLYLVFRILIAKIILIKPAAVAIADLPLSIRLLSIPQIFLYYIKTFFYPKDLAISQFWTVKSAALTTFYLPLLSVVLIVLCLIFPIIYFYKRRKEALKPYVFFLLWFLAGMSFHIQLIPLDMTVADRWFYFPIVGLLGGIGIFLNNSKISKHAITYIFLGAIITLFSTRTIIRNMNWKDSLTLFSHDAQYTDSYDLESNLGAELAKIGNNEEAGIHFKRSIELEPSYWFNWTNLATYYYNKGDYDSAGKALITAMENGPDFAPAYEYYAILLYRHQDQGGGEVKVFLEKSLNTFPKNDTLWHYLALVNYKLGLKEDALNAAKNAFNLNPNEDNTILYEVLDEEITLNLKR